MFSNNGKAASAGSKGRLHPTTAAPSPVVPKPDPDAPAQQPAAVPQAKRRSPLPRSPLGPGVRPPTPWVPQGRQAEPAGRKRPFGSTHDGPSQQPAKKQATPTSSSPPRAGGAIAAPPGPGHGDSNKPPRKRWRKNRPAAPARSAAPVPVEAPTPVPAPAPLNNPFALVRSPPGAPSAQPLAPVAPFATAYAPASTALAVQQHQPQPQHPQQQKHEYHYHHYFIYNNMHMTWADARGVGPHGRGGVVQVSGGPADGRVREITDVTMLDEGAEGVGAGLAKGWGGTSE